ncbi:MAG: PEP-CTERM sorting domain-containing protein [Myxococcota bacterium]|nr:PEP-CTERM sorting domain-containing protein [Myxococcota bacterium]
MRALRLLFVALLVTLPLHAHAIVISTSIGDYEVTPLTGSFDTVSPTLMSQVWWGNALLAGEFRSGLGGGLGFPNVTDPIAAPGLGSPIFAFADGTGGSWEGQWTRDDGNIGTIQGPGSLPLVWAVAQAVPEPGALALVAAGMLGLVRCGSRERNVASSHAQRSAAR